MNDRYIGITQQLNIVKAAYSNIDSKYGPYDSIEDALSATPISLRKEGLTVGILVNHDIIEHWFDGGIEDIHLVQKTTNKIYFTNDYFDYYEDGILSIISTTSEINNSTISLIDSYTKENVNYEETTTWHYNIAMDDSKVDNIIYRKKGNKYYQRKNADGIIKVEWFGAVGDGITDDTLAIKEAVQYINSIPLNEGVTGKPYAFNSPELLLSASEGYLISDTIMITAVGVFFNNTSNIYWRGTPDRPALYFDGLNKAKICVSLNGVVPLNAGNKNSEGIVMRNVINSEIHIRSCNFFYRAIICLADGYGFAWNNIYLGNLSGNMNSLVVKSINGGWPNANNVYGGNFGSSTGFINISTVTEPRNYIKFESDGIYGANSWNFYNMWFEGGENRSASLNGYETLVLYAPDKAIVRIKFQDCRVEYVNNEKIISIIKDSVVIFTSDMFVANNKILYTDGTRVLNSMLANKITNTKNILSFSKYINGKHYVRELETFNFISGINGNDELGKKVGYLLSVSENKIFNVNVPRRLSIVCLDSDFNIINDNSILSAQLSKISSSMYLYDTYATTKILYSSADLYNVKYYIRVVSGISYMFVGTEVTNNGIITIESENDDIRYIKKNPEYTADPYAYVIPTTIEALGGTYTNIFVGEKYYSKANKCIYEITKSDAVSIEYITHKKMTSQANSTAIDVPSLVTDFNSLLGKLRSTGLLSQ